MSSWQHFHVGSLIFFESNFWWAFYLHHLNKTSNFNFDSSLYYGRQTRPTAIKLMSRFDASHLKENKKSILQYIEIFLLKISLHWFRVNGCWQNSTIFQKRQSNTHVVKNTMIFTYEDVFTMKKKVFLNWWCENEEVFPSSRSLIYFKSHLVKNIGKNINNAS